MPLSTTPATALVLVASRPEDELLEASRASSWPIVEYQQRRDALHLVRTMRPVGVLTQVGRAPELDLTLDTIQGLRRACGRVAVQAWSKQHSTSLEHAVRQAGAHAYGYGPAGLRVFSELIASRLSSASASSRFAHGPPARARPPNMTEHPP